MIISKRLLAARAILNTYWDPIHIENFEEYNIDEYDTYAAHILAHKWTQPSLEQYLLQTAVDIMGSAYSETEERARVTAEKLLSEFNLTIVGI